MVVCSNGRSRVTCGIQVKGSNDTALRASPWPSRMAVDQSVLAWSGSAKPMRRGRDHSSWPDGRGSVSPRARRALGTATDWARLNQWDDGSQDQKCGAISSVGQAVLDAVCDPSPRGHREPKVIEQCHAMSTWPGQARMDGSKCALWDAAGGGRGSGPSIVECRQQGHGDIRMGD